MSERYYLVSDAAKLLKVHPSTIIRAANEGRINVATRTAGGCRLFRIDDLERYAGHIRRRTKRAA